MKAFHTITITFKESERDCRVEALLTPELFWIPYSTFASRIFDGDWNNNLEFHEISEKLKNEGWFCKIFPFYLKKLELI